MLTQLDEARVLIDKLLESPECAAFLEKTVEETELAQIAETNAQNKKQKLLARRQ